MQLAKRDPAWQDLQSKNGQKGITRFSGPKGLKKRKQFLELLAATGLWAHSAMACGVDPETPRRLAKRDKEFGLACEHAREHYGDTVRTAIHTRAVDGTPEEVWYQGAKVGEKKVKSDRLLELLARAKCPEFREKIDVETTHRGGVLVVGVQAKSPEEWAEKHGGPKVVKNDADPALPTAPDSPE